MKEIAEGLGFVFLHKGCPCEGAPLHYKKEIAGRTHILKIYRGRHLWRLICRSEMVAKGNETNMHQLLTEYEANITH